MSKHRYTLTEEVDPQEITNLSEGHKQNLLERGMRPYRTSHGRIVWANESIRLYKMSRHSSPSLKLFSKKPKHLGTRVRRGSKKSALAYFIRDNIWLILILLAVAAVLVAVLKYNFLIG